MGVLTMINDEQQTDSSFIVWLPRCWQRCGTWYLCQRRKRRGVSTYFGWRRRRASSLSDVARCGARFVVMDVVEERGCGLLLMSKSDIGVCRYPFWESDQIIGIYSIKYIYIIKPSWCSWFSTHIAYLHVLMRSRVQFNDIAVFLYYIIITTIVHWNSVRLLLAVCWTFIGACGSFPVDWGCWFGLSPSEVCWKNPLG